MQISDQLTWDQVALKHGSRAAVRLSSTGTVSSILCGGPNHSDQVSETSVDYSIPDRPYYSRVIAAFQETMRLVQTFDVYHKIDKNQWKHLGAFVVKDIIKLQSEYKVRLLKNNLKNI